MKTNNKKKSKLLALLGVASLLLLCLCFTGLCLATAAYANMYQWTDKHGITYNVDDISKIPPDKQKNINDKPYNAPQLFAGSWIEKEDQFEFRGEKVAVRLESDGTGYRIITSFWKTVRSPILWRKINDNAIELLDPDAKNNRIVKYDKVFDELENYFGGHYPLRRMKQPLPPTVRATSKEIPFSGFWMNWEPDINSNLFITIERDGTGLLFPWPDYFIPFTWTPSKNAALELTFEVVSRRGNEQEPIQSDFAKNTAKVSYNGKTDTLELSVKDKKYYLFWIDSSAFQGKRPSNDVIQKLETFDGRKELAKSGNSAIALIVAEYYLYRTGPNYRHEALPWLIKAAESGLPEAQYMSGYLLYFGEYAPLNKVEGLRWMQRAAKSNNASAIAFLERIEQGDKASVKYFGYQNPQNYWEKGSRLDNEGKHDEAIENFTKAIILNKGEISPTSLSSVYQARGHVYMRRWQYAEALADFNSAVKIDMKNANAYNSIGLAYKSMRKEDLAIEAFNKAIEINSQNRIFYNNRASTYEIKGEYEKALNDYNKATELKPEDAGSYIGRGIVFKKQKKYKEALQEFDKAQEIEPKQFLAHYHKSSLYSLWNLTNEACRELEVAIDSGLSKWNKVKTVIEKNADFDSIRKTDCFNKAMSRF